MKGHRFQGLVFATFLQFRFHDIEPRTPTHRRPDPVRDQREAPLGRPGRTDRRIDAGHGRVLAARKLGLETVPVIVLEHLTDAQARAYVIADNRLGEIGGGWDWDMLRAELDHLGELGDIDISLTGFNPEDLPSGDLEGFEVPGDEQRGGADTNYLTFGDRKVPLDGEELVGLTRLLDDHMANTGSPFGFVTNILRRCSR